MVVCGDGEYIIYTAMALRNKSFGSAQEFVWAADSSEYAVRENASTVKLFKNFKEKKTFRPDFGAEAIFGGYMLGVKSPSGLSFYDWESLELVRRIEIQPKAVYWCVFVNCGFVNSFLIFINTFLSWDMWPNSVIKAFTFLHIRSENGELVCIATEESYFVLKYDADAVARARETKEDITEDGIETAFDVRVLRIFFSLVFLKLEGTNPINTLLFLEKSRLVLKSLAVHYTGLDTGSNTVV